MAWSTPATWVAGAVLTAAQLNAQLRDNLNAAFPLGIDAWTSYTPTLTQSATVTKTVTYGKYQRIGRLIVAQGFLTVTGAGTAANAVLVGLPVSAASNAGQSIGGGKITDVSASLSYRGVCEVVSATTFAYVPTVSNANNYLGSTDFTAALASGDVVIFSIAYEAVT